MNRRNLFKLAASALLAPLAKFFPKGDPLDSVEYMATRVAASWSGGILYMYDDSDGSICMLSKPDPSAGDPGGEWVPVPSDISLENWYCPFTDRSGDEIRESMREELKTTIFETPLKEAQNGIS